jgi:1-aminocyclopropane-1-carboxylate deaminase/D-cysteine desulfhydrase-like pyridoxal-dependent ACC family enzyme
VIASGTGTMALFAARHFQLKSLKEVENSRLRRYPTGTGKPDHGGGRNGADINSGDITAGERATGSVLEPKEIAVEVVAVPCVGSDVHLLDQMRSLDLQSGCHNIFPIVLRTERDVRPTVETAACSTIERDEATSSERVFGEPCAAHYLLWDALKSSMGMDFDLIYAPRTFELLLESFQHDVDLLKDCNILYYHCGGMEGNESQLGRYKYRKIITR